MAKFAARRVKVSARSHHLTDSRFVNSADLSQRLDPSIGVSQENGILPTTRHVARLLNLVRRPVSTVLMEDEARYDPARVVSECDLRIHFINEEVIAAFWQEAHRGAASSRSDKERSALHRDIEFQPWTNLIDADILRQRGRRKLNRHAPPGRERGRRHHTK